MARRRRPLRAPHPSEVSPKVTAATAAAAVATIAAFYLHWPLLVEGAAATVFTFAFGWLVPDPTRQG